MSARTLGGMYRQAGLVVLGIGAVLGLTMVFTGFEHAVKSWEVDFDSGDVSQVTVACPAPFGIVFGDAEMEADPSWGARVCAGTGQRLFIAGVAWLAVGTGIGLWGIRRGPKPKRQSIDAIPSFRDPGEES